MNEISSNEINVFQNPEKKPLEDLKLSIQKDGVVMQISALDKYWVESKSYLYYEPPNLIDSDGKEIIGAKEHWLELANFIYDDLTGLLHLPFYKFWSNIVYNSDILDSIISFLQEAPTFYTLEDFPNDFDIREYYNKIRQTVLIIFARLVTRQESVSEYISATIHAQLLYDNYIFTVPILMDICQLYGRDNRKTIEKIVQLVFTIQPLYKQDLSKAVTFIIEALRNIEKRFEDCPIDQEGKAILLSERGGANIEITLPNLEDVILYLLDTVSTVNIFIDIYPLAAKNFKHEHFVTKIISVYGSTITEIYKRLEDLTFKDEMIAKYTDLRYRLDVARVEILNIYRKIIYKNIEDIIKDGSEIHCEMEDIVEDFLSNIMHILSEKEFVIDYHNMYPVSDDFETLQNLCSDLDSVKCEFILNSIFTLLDEPVSALLFIDNKKSSEIIHNRPSNTKNHNMLDIGNESIRSETSKTKPEIDLKFLISEVKDILCDLGEGFIERCLKFYNYKKEAVINAVLEDTLPLELKSLDHSLPFIPPDPEEKLATIESALGFQRLNIYDNDEFDVMTKDNIDITRMHKGKRKDTYKNLNDLLNDKSHIAETKDIYNKYSIVSEYDDEYDDTYDDHDVGSSAQDDIVEVDARLFTVPRVLQKRENNDYEEDIEEETDDEPQGNKDNFVQDPALLRAKMEERRLNKRMGHSSIKNVTGNPKGQGQAKEVVDNRNQKNKNKSTRANHNRRVGSQWKRSRGMVPT